MKIVRFVFGLPCSGKSTYIKNNLINYSLVSVDKMNKKYDANLYDSNKIYSMTMKDIESLINKFINDGEHHIVFEYSLMDDECIKNIINHAKSYDYIIEVIFINTPLNVCIDRSIKRGYSKKESIKTIINNDAAINNSKLFLEDISDMFIEENYFPDNDISVDMELVSS